MDSKLHPLRAWRENEGWTQTEVAEHVGVVASFITMIEQGRRTPSLETAAKLAELTGIPMQGFLRETVE